MIGKIQGIIDSVYTDHAIIMTSGGVGYRIFFNSRALSTMQKGESLSIFTETNVKEDHIHLFGFMNDEEKVWFQLLTSVQGVGPKAGMAILSALTPAELYTAISSQDKAMVGRANGIGPKIAARILLELEKKLSKIPAAMSVDNFELTSDTTTQKITANEKIIARDEAVSALVNLGYNRNSAYNAIVEILKNEPSIKTSDLIRTALKMMDKF